MTLANWLSLAFWAVLGGGLLVLLVWAGRWLVRWWRDELPQPQVFGSAHWMTRRELRRSSLLTEQAGIVCGRWRGRPLRDAGEGHCLIVGRSRSGKGTTHVVPSLIEWPHDLIALDPKGELFDLTAGWRRSKGSAVYAFDPMGDDDASTRINLLESIRLGTPHALADADLLARSLIPDPGPSNPASAYYRREAVDILASTLVYVRECDSHKTLAGVLAFMTSQEPFAKRLQRMAHASHPAVQTTVNTLLAMDDRERKPLWSAAAAGLSLWKDPRIVERTASSDLDLGRFQEAGAPPISLYLRSPEAQLERLSPIQRSIVQVIIGRAMERPPDRTRRKVLFLLDEFGSLGTCTPLVTSMPRMAGYQLRLCLVIQDLTDLIRHYGPHHNILANCDTRIFHRPNDVFTAGYVSRLLGDSTVEYLAERDGRSFGTSGISDSHLEGMQIARRPLMTLAEVTTFPDDEVLLFALGLPPLRAKKIAWNDAAYWTPRHVSERGAYGAHVEAQKHHV